MKTVYQTRKLHGGYIWIDCPLITTALRLLFLHHTLTIFFQQKLWFSFTEDGDLPEDILPDFFANIFYDITYKNILVEPLIKTKVRTLNELNIR